MDHQYSGDFAAFGEARNRAVRVAFVVLVLSLLLENSITATSYAMHCPRGYYKNPSLVGGQRSCLPCSRCPSGYGMRRPCSVSSDTKCVACVKGVTYSNNGRTQRQCRLCTRCGLHQKMTSNCSLTNDARCSLSCEKGYYWDHASLDCKACSWCFPDKVHPQDAPVATECRLPGIPAAYRCARFTIDHSELQPTWFDYMANEDLQTRDDDSHIGDFYGSGEPIEMTDDRQGELFPNDDEELVVFPAQKNTSTKLPETTASSTDFTAVSSVALRAKGIHTPLPIPLSAKINPAPIRTMDKSESNDIPPSNQNVIINTVTWLTLVLAVVAILLSIFTLFLLGKQNRLTKRYLNYEEKTTVNI